jgi:chemotaxis protein CheX
MGMNVEFINPFINSTLNFFTTMVGISPKRGEIYAQKEDNSQGNDVSAVIGLTGDYSGWIAVRLSKQTAMKIACSMLQEEKKYVDADVRDAIAEVVNIIAGGAKGELSAKGFTYKIALPTVIVGDDHVLSHMKKNIYLVIPFQSEFGSFSIDVCLEQAAK